MYSVQELEQVLREAEADFQLIRQDAPILSSDSPG